ncbi:MAG: glycosyltransferase family 2 protein [Gammaproteobacteria bacterium]|nr:glycosyltransferase family 2 protein [Gammaproteobacteria bacterium]
MVQQAPILINTVGSEITNALDHRLEFNKYDAWIQLSIVDSFRQQALNVIQTRLSATDIADHHNQSLFMGLSWLLIIIVTLILVYAIRHYLFTLNRLFGVQRYPYLDIDTAEWPNITVFVAAHNEEAVIAGAIAALLEVDYPADKMTIMPVNDRSTDKTREIIDEFVKKNPLRITPFHRGHGKPGKAAALKDATELVDRSCEIIIVFDADYIPSRGLIKQLVAPFFDPEVGASMGRVVPNNVGSNLLTRLLDLERAGGYQVDQQARMNMRLLPQYGGTVGGIRLTALKSISGWDDSVLAEDTDITYRLLLNNWKTVYQNRAECYEEVPEDWAVRIRQIKRWAKGHNQALVRHIAGILRKSDLRWPERIDGALLLGIYALAPLLICGWVISIILFYYFTSPIVTIFMASFSIFSFSAFGNFGAFFQVAAATYLDRNQNRTRLLPLMFSSFVVSTFSISIATCSQLIDALFKREIKWDKTARYRKAP